MKRIVFPYHAGNKASRAFALAIVAGAVLIATCAAASIRPKYGGTLRVQMSERVATIDPRQWPSDSNQAAATERVASLAFDRLLRFDDHGEPQAALAISWQSDAETKRWQFRLREGVKFSDGAPFTPEAAALALQQLLGNAFEVSATSGSIVIEADRALPDFPAQLAGGRYYIFRAADDGSLAGTGPFRVTQWPSRGASDSAAVFLADETCWAGRPFVDRIELTMGVSIEEQGNAIAFGQADVVDLPASQVRRATGRGVRATSSDPIDLFALVFDMSRPAVQDAGFREAIALAIDRASIADVVLQRQGVATGGLLPNWISGYEFLFPVAPNLPRAKKLLAAAGRDVSRAAPIALVYDSRDAEARAIAERVAVNLRQAGIAVQPSGTIAGDNKKAVTADVRLLRHRIAAPEPAVALESLLIAFGDSAGPLEATGQSITPAITLDADYAAERGPIDAFRVIPLVHVSESHGLGPRVRDWMAPRWGGWRLDDVWLDLAQAESSVPGGAGP